MKKIIVVGGGPAGMMAAGKAAESGAAVTLIEQNRILGKKLLITGKGRCNVTNYCDENEFIAKVVHNPKFLYSAISAFNAYDAYAFFEELGVPLKIERGNRVFPVSDLAADVRNAMRRYIERSGVHILEDRIKRIEKEPFILYGERGTYTCDALIIATGGCSYPLTGSTGDGYDFALRFGHTVRKAEPALVALTEQGNSCENLAGLSLRNVKLTAFNCKGNTLYTDFGEMLFTHNGISGPLVLSASSMMEQSDFPCRIVIDLKPALSEEELDKRLLRDFEEYVNKDFCNALDRLLPQKIIPQIIERSGISPRSKVHQITRQQRNDLIGAIKGYKINIKEKAGFEEAIITSGGVDVKDVNPKTMESKLVKNLYFAGEILDVDAFTGGFNLQIAYSTGFLAGVSAGKE